MSLARKLALIKRAASIALLLCFLLPLSRCDGHVDPGTGVQGADTVTTGFSLLLDFAHGLAASPFESILCMLAVIAVFMGPLCTLALRKGWELLLCLCGAVLAWHALGAWVFVMGHPMPGGWLACGCWCAIALVSLVELVAYGRRRFAPSARTG